MDEIAAMIARADALIDEGNRLYIANQPSQANALWTEARQLCAGVEGAEVPLAHAIRNLGHGAQADGQLEQALALIRESKAISDQANDLLGICKCLINEGLVLHQLHCKYAANVVKRSEYDGALDCLERAQELAVEGGWDWQLIAALTVEADVLDCLPFRGVSSSTLERLRAAYLKVGRRDKAAQVMSRLATQELDVSLHDEALATAEEPSTRATCLANLAASRIELEQYEQADEVLGEAQRLCDQYHLDSERVQVMIQRALLLHAMGEVERAGEEASQAMEAAEALADPKLIADAEAAAAEIEGQDVIDDFIDGFFR